jgi:pimeloyl-ACP methyl ester carboxylesterase
MASDIAFIQSLTPLAHIAAAAANITGSSVPDTDILCTTVTLSDLVRLHTHAILNLWALFYIMACVLKECSPGQFNTTRLRSICADITTFDRYLAPIPENERDDLLKAFHKRLTGKNAQARAEAAAAWARWEGETLSIQGPKQRPPRFDEADFLDAFARIECHYFVNKGFFEKDGWLLEQAAKFGDLPGVIVHGRYDVVTPLDSAWKLHKAWPKSQLKIVPDAGHSSLEPGIISELVKASDWLAEKVG